MVSEVSSELISDLGGMGSVYGSLRLCAPRSPMYFIVSCLVLGLFVKVLNVSKGI